MLCFTYTIAIGHPGSLAETRRSGLRNGTSLFSSEPITWPRLPRDLTSVCIGMGVGGIRVALMGMRRSPVEGMEAKFIEPKAWL